jgi:hypothetical protein
MNRLTYTLLVAAVCLSLTTQSTQAQTLYATTEGPPFLLTLNPTTGDVITTVGALTNVNGVDIGRSIAMDPISGTMYGVYPDFAAGDWQFASLDLGTGAFTNIANMGNERIRDMTFDSTGKLWAVMGAAATNPHALVSVNTSTAALTVENGSLPTVSNRIAYDPKTDTLYLQGEDGPDAELYTLSPSTPGTLNAVTLSGVPIFTGSQPGMVFDPIVDRLLIKERDVEGWTMITPAGFVSRTATIDDVVLAGLAFDQATTSIPVELSAFEIE